MDATKTSLVDLLSDPNRLAKYLIDFGWKMLGAVVVLIVGILIIKLVVSLVRTTTRRAVPEPTVRNYVISASQIALWLVLFMILLGIFGLDTTGIITILGAAGLAIGLALQGTLSNFASGIMLMVFRPFKAGDTIEVAGVSGTAIEIGIFTSIVDMPDNVRAFVPNSMIFTGVIKNRSINEYIRLDMMITLHGDADIAKAQQVIQRLLIQNELVLEVPRPEVQVLENDSPGVSIGVRPYAKLRNAEAVRTTIMRDIRAELLNAGIEVARQ
ncbi:MAG: mechanosensitive ion channel family protein [bacterium]|nr:mechanosensitive ion channel family protein [Candidatus Kapabacteria bacterium]